MCYYRGTAYAFGGVVVLSRESRDATDGDGMGVAQDGGEDVVLTHPVRAVRPLNFILKP